MKKLFFILTAGFVFYGIRYTAASDCAKTPVSPEIEFTTSYGKLRYSSEYDNRRLTEVAALYGISEKGLFASGLSTVNINWEISTDTLGQLNADGSVCVVPAKVNFYLGFSDPVIYISNELQPESCEYNVVKRHEQTHQQINKTALDYFLPLFRDALHKIIAAVPPEQVNHISQIDNATTRLTAEYNRRLAPLIDVFKEELLLEQSKLDNRDNYLHEKNLCR